MSVVFLWGVGFGAFIANALNWWRSRKPTQEHRIGVRVVEAGKDVLFTRRMTGGGVQIRNVSVLRIGEGRVSVAVEDIVEAAGVGERE